LLCVNLLKAGQLKKKSSARVAGERRRVNGGELVDSSGDTPKAKTAYQDFLALWKDTDPDIPIQRQAKAEYAKLQ
jgi:hypothetical protein